MINWWNYETVYSNYFSSYIIAVSLDHVTRRNYFVSMTWDFISYCSFSNMVAMAINWISDCMFSNDVLRSRYLVMMTVTFHLIMTSYNCIFCAMFTDLVWSNYDIAIWRRWWLWLFWSFRLYLLDWLWFMDMFWFMNRLWFSDRP